MTTATYPKSTDYKLAVQNPHVVFRDPELAASNVEKDPRGQPVLRGGAFAVTFHLARGGQDWAVRCFKQELGDLEQRYTKISAVLRRAALPCFAGFEYQPDGILVEGRRLPIVKMAWVPGVTLGAYVERYYRDAARMSALAAHFRGTVKLLGDAGIAHGDLQHANIMASDTGVTLIDYDGMYVPGIGLSYSNEIGHVNYQSPLRTGIDYNAAMDRFSAIVIMLTLRALERDPSLWGRYGDTGEQLLFGRPDFLDPDASALMHDLRAMPDLKAETMQLQKLCRTPLERMPTLEAFLAGARVSADTAVVLPLPSVRIRQYDVLRATEREGILARIGDRIEVVGQVAEVKHGHTRYGKPYAFINFGDWRTGAFQIILWSETLERFAGRGLDVSSFVGRWLSVIGLVEEYRAKRHVPQIIVSDPNDLRVLDSANEAKQIFADGQGAPPTVTARTPDAGGTRSRNDEIRQNLRSLPNLPGPAPSTPNLPSAPSQRPSPPASPPSTPTMPPQFSPQSSRSNADVRRNLAKLAAPATAPVPKAPTAPLNPHVPTALPTVSAPAPVRHSPQSPPSPVLPATPSTTWFGFPKVMIMAFGIVVVLAIVLGSIFSSSGTSPSQPAAQGQSPSTNVPPPAPTITLPPIPTATRTSPLAALPTATTASERPAVKPLDGSWMAAAPTISVRFFAMPWWVAQQDASGADHFALGLADGNAGFESFDMYRYRNREGSDQPAAWQSEFRGNVAFSSGDAPVVTRQPQPQLAGQNRGQLGQYHYVERATGRQMDVTLWVGQVGPDRAVLVFRGTPDRDAQIDQAVMQVLATIDFDARQ